MDELFENGNSLASLSPNPQGNDDKNQFHIFNYLEMVQHLSHGIVRCGLDMHNCLRMYHKPLDYNGIT